MEFLKPKLQGAYVVLKNKVDASSSSQRERNNVGKIKIIWERRSVILLFCWSNPRSLRCWWVTPLPFSAGYLPHQFLRHSLSACPMRRGYQSRHTTSPNLYPFRNQRTIRVHYPVLCIPSTPCDDRDNCSRFDGLSFWFSIMSPCQKASFKNHVPLFSTFEYLAPISKVSTKSHPWSDSVHSSKINRSIIDGCGEMNSFIDQKLLLTCHQGYVALQFDDMMRLCITDCPFMTQCAHVLGLNDCE
uniref:AlNc14C71G4872 protein n=1 Tax=Albugo laibachii Nc14 TaxID=890382 RepID=F0WE07_9STRA|nr:AlNc14C71G4872 [Albugo laibachii Nc14]|eukprot:CCA19436.1 AlNc14C71G4872 [Albugo laibachii Nc14]